MRDAARSGLRTGLLVLLPGALILFGWERIERPAPALLQLAWVAAIGLAPALLPRWWMRITAALIALAVVLHPALRVSVLDARPRDKHHDFFGPLFSHFGRGLGAFYDVALPFDGHQNVYMHGVILLAIFAGCLCVGFAVAARRPALAALALLVWAAWPMTLYTGPGDLWRGAFVLVGVLILLTASRPVPGRNPGFALSLVVVLVVAALGASTSPAVAKSQFLNWQTWDLYTRPDNPVNVSFVWNSNYDGIKFPKKVTTVFKAKAGPTPRYWRATTLDSYAGDRWIESLTPISPQVDGRRDVLTADPWLPARARNQKQWVESRVTMGALLDPHLIGPETPVAFDRGDVDSITYEAGGVATASAPLTRDQSYTVWSYAPQPTPKQLRAAGTSYPPGFESYLAVAPRVDVPSFSRVGRDELMQQLFRFNRVDPSYQRLYQAATRVTSKAKTPYDATVAVEAWLRSNPAFTYTQHPRRPIGLPDLVWFVTEGHQGYCQHFAGAMALMLRYLGIPARVAAGFTTGKYNAGSKTWTVTDHDAHTWVEAYFPGYGWLPFDPTPSRGSLSGSYSSASSTFDVAGAGFLAVAARLGLPVFKGKGSRFGFRPESGIQGIQADVPRKGGGGVTGVITGSGRSASLLRLLALVALCGILLVALAKVAVRRGRYLTRDPRRIASACRRELTDFLVDQRIAVPGSATPHELSRIVDEELGVDGRGFADAVSGARFGPPASAAEAAKQARRERKRILGSIRAELPRARRVLGLVSLRSLGVTR